MSALDQLSSRVGSRTQDANAKVAQRCLADPRLLPEITGGLGSKDARLAGDCAEVMTKIAEQRPELVAPEAETLLALLSHPNGRVRWESAHATALVARHVPRLIRESLPRLQDIVRRDESVIVRDYVLDAVAGYGATGPKAAAEAFPLLRFGLDAWGSKHAARVLRGLVGVARAAPKLCAGIQKLAERFEEDDRPGVRKAATSLRRALAARTP